MIEISEHLEVGASPAQVWEILRDPPAVASCIPGCVLGEQRSDGSYDAKLAVRFGGIRVRFNVIVQLDIDDDRNCGVMVVTGADGQRGTRVSGNGQFTVSPAAGGRSSVGVDGRVEIRGRLASIVATGASVVVKRMSKEFGVNLEELLQSGSHQSNSEGTAPA